MFDNVTTREGLHVTGTYRRKHDTRRAMAPRSSRGGLVTVPPGGPRCWASFANSTEMRMPSRSTPSIFLIAYSCGCAYLFLLLVASFKGCVEWRLDGCSACSGTFENNWNSHATLSKSTLSIYRTAYSCRCLYHASRPPKCLSKTRYWPKSLNQGTGQNRSWWHIRLESGGAKLSYHEVHCCLILN